jgi:hypothetical protein
MQTFQIEGPSKKDPVSDNKAFDLPQIPLITMHKLLSTSSTITYDPERDMRRAPYIGSQQDSPPNPPTDITNEQLVASSMAVIDLQTDFRETQRLSSETGLQ